MGKQWEGKIHVGLRDKETGDLIKAYPEAVEGSMQEIKDKVFFWYYQQSCEAETNMRNYIVDVLDEKEL